MGQKRGVIFDKLYFRTFWTFVSLPSSCSSLSRTVFLVTVERLDVFRIESMILIY